MHTPSFSSLLALTLSLAPLALSSVIPTNTTPDERYLVRRALRTGLGTRYCPDGKEEDCWQDGACAFVDYTLPSGIDGSTCVSEEIWDSSAHCGKCIQVTYKGKTIKVMVTNKTGGGPNHLDMPPSTWSQLTNNYSGGGVDGIQWKFIDCPITMPLQIRAHGGSSQYWPSVTIENATKGTTKVEFSDDQGATWHGSTRNTNNFFVMDGTLSQAKVWVRVTGEGGGKVVVKRVELASGIVTKASRNF